MPVLDRALPAVRCGVRRDVECGRPQGTLAVLAFGIIIGVYYWRSRALGAMVLTHVLADVLALT